MNYFITISTVKTPDSKFTIITSLEDVSIILTILVSTSVLIGGIINLISRYIAIKHKVEGIEAILIQHDEDIEELRRGSSDLQRQIDRCVARHDERC
jgi:hypothetical protein